ncbi:MAG: agmatinase family protein, partial [Desulfovibrionaceae bacterium]
RGPAAILAASQQLELFDGQSCPGEEGIHTAPAPDLDGPLEQAVDAIAAAVDQSLAAGGLPILLGGEHTVTVGALRALRHHAMNIGVVQFDAHADLRDQYEETHLSHACVMRRAADLGVPVHQLGVRSLCMEENKFRNASPLVSFQDARDLWFEPRPALRLPDDFPRDVHLTIDLDALDSSLMPATGTPEPGGLMWPQLMALLEDLARTRRIVSADVVELAPAPGLHGCDYLAAKLVYVIMGLVQRGAAKKG